MFRVYYCSIDTRPLDGKTRPSNWKTKNFNIKAKALNFAGKIKDRYDIVRIQDCDSHKNIKKYIKGKLNTV